MSTSGQGPLWMKVTQSIQSMMKESGLVPGDRLPKETLLAARFKVNRHTVRRALKHLEGKGLIEARQGRGRFLRRPAIQYQIDARPRFSSNLACQGVEAKFKLLNIASETASERVANALSLRAGSKVIHVERLGFADDNPVSLASHYLPLGRFPSFIELYMQHHSITATLLGCGVEDYVRRSTRVTSRLPTARERELLGTPKHVPLLVTRSTNIDSRGWPIEYGDARTASNCVELEISLSPSRDR